MKIFFYILAWVFCGLITCYIEKRANPYFDAANAFINLAGGPIKLLCRIIADT